MHRGVMKIIRPVANKIGKSVTKVTAPIRSTKAWKWLRKYVLRSPFGGYFVSSWQELKQVTWPDRKTSVKLTGVVITFTLIFVAFTALLDLGFERVAREIFLK